ncbi:adenosine deaminase [Patellaria atrata CBS 101060]|uniref:adenosine deaminase n=1 Tax=Patellaria atrata CBS 101060 TaxID=1346257 RepID=A0A9P4SAB1_9PEZI|nr:adenosine deaminase [Patellaria atrata CBS 101060]
MPPEKVIEDTSQVITDKFENHLGNVKPEDYLTKKNSLIEEEELVEWDHDAKLKATKTEKDAARVVFLIREDEREGLFGNKASEAIPDPTTRDMGGQFLTNRDRIEQSIVYQIAKEAPKGAHLHLHFNSEIPAPILLQRALGIDNMFIRSTKPLLELTDFDQTEIVFNVLPDDTPTANIFSPDYDPDVKKKEPGPWMKLHVFRANFPNPRGIYADRWLIGKMVVTEDEVYGKTQTINGIWARFNQATRAFKGLLNYESIYRWYIGSAIDSMIKDGVMYTEMRPMLMDKFIPADNGVDQVDHFAQMTIIQEEVQKKMIQLGNDIDKFPFGVKIIYCAPRSIPKTRMQQELKDCIKLKLKFPDLICGFDLVGAEDRANHIGFYANELTAFVETCKSLNIEIPFFFHAGETLLDTGGSRHPENSNVFDALLFNSRRIGHGIALLKHPDLIQEYKKKNICIELCPISNELLHLCRTIKEHPYPQLLAAGLHCTVNSDNPSLFSSSLSHEFYQVMVGTPKFSLHGWRQLALWSLEHSCLTDAEKERAINIFTARWEAFCQWIIDEHGPKANEIDARFAAELVAKA